jgi:uncharacterized protein (TIGR02145 family)
LKISAQFIRYKSSSTNATFNDVIEVIKDGYINYLFSITKQDTTGIMVKMINTAGTVTDIDGNIYQTVKIGNQIWTTENLRTTRLNDGTSIPHLKDSASWLRDTLPGYCYYNNGTDEYHVKRLGALYNWYTVKTGKLAPNGWHVPDDSEWNTLQNYLFKNGYTWDASGVKKIGKAICSQAYWTPYTGFIDAVGNNLSKNNKSGFSALPSGYRRGDDGVFFGYEGSGCIFWSSSESDHIASGNGFYIFKELYGMGESFYEKNFGASVRLVKD